MSGSMHICETGKNKTIVEGRNRDAGKKRNVGGNGSDPAVLDQNVLFEKSAVFIDLRAMSWKVMLFGPRFAAS